MTEIQGGAWAGFQAQLASKQDLCAHSSSATSWKPEQKGPDHCVAAINDPTWSQSSQALPMAGSRLIMRRTEAKMQGIEGKSASDLDKAVEKLEAGTAAQSVSSWQAR